MDTYSVDDSSGKFVGFIKGNDKKDALKRLAAHNHTYRLGGCVLGSGTHLKGKRK